LKVIPKETYYSCNVPLGPYAKEYFAPPPPFFSSRILPFENLFIEVIEIVALEGRPCFYEINEGDSGGLI
jgi:hypothetical protein